MLFENLIERDGLLGAQAPVGFGAGESVQVLFAERRSLRFRRVGSGCFAAAHASIVTRLATARL
jgi:hypothetical protein